ncbi:hypothetical protein AAE478_008771 [Parahypoxylon ruwenzoriense]
MKWTSAPALRGGILTLAALSRRAAAQGPDIADFDWTSISPSSSLVYTPCYDTHRCARLSVPLDWLNSNSTDALATIAIIARPATVPESDPRFGGTIIVNPGGPGGSGVEFVLSTAELMQGIADASGTKHYEILSFDPRGTGRTTPSGDCFADEFARGNSVLELRALGPLDGGRPIVARQRALMGAYAEQCARAGQAAAGHNVRAYFSTASVARDMVEIVDKIDELRRIQNGTAAPARRDQPDATPRIQYWGVSYGTVLGNYFASMFPGRVGRMVLEGVVDAQDYHEGKWEKNLFDSQEALDYLWQTCFRAGPNCALYQPNDTSPDSIRRRFYAFLSDLDDAPASYVSESSSSIELLTRQDVTNTVLGALFLPLSGFPSIADVLAQAMRGDYAALYNSLGLPQSSSSCAPAPASAYTWGQDAMFSIACGDSVPQTNTTTAEFEAYVARLAADSPDFGPNWTRLRLACTRWRVRAAYDFAGPWTTPSADRGLVEGRPAAPLLFLSNRVDPGTPLVNAYAMAEGHPGSRVLVQNSTGHCTYHLPSRCRDDFLSRYFETGELPPEGEVCQPDCVPFQECLPTGLAARSLDAGAGWEPRRRKASLGGYY